MVEDGGAGVAVAAVVVVGAAVVGAVGDPGDLAAGWSGDDSLLPLRKTVDGAGGIWREANSFSHKVFFGGFLQLGLCMFLLGLCQFTGPGSHSKASPEIQSTKCIKE